MRLSKNIESQIHSKWNNLLFQTKQDNNQLNKLSLNRESKIAKMLIGLNSSNYKPDLRIYNPNNQCRRIYNSKSQNK